MHPTHLVSVAALVTNEKGEILLVNSPWRGWEYPGGLIGSLKSILLKVMKSREYNERGSIRNPAIYYPFYYSLQNNTYNKPSILHGELTVSA